MHIFPSSGFATLRSKSNLKNVLRGLGTGLSTEGVTDASGEVIRRSKELKSETQWSSQGDLAQRSGDQEVSRTMVSESDPR